VFLMCGFLDLWWICLFTEGIEKVWRNQKECCKCERTRA
jgi:hypothetical protein